MEDKQIKGGHGHHEKMKKTLILFLCAILVTAPVFTETASAAAKTASSEAKKTSSAAKRKRHRSKAGTDVQMAKKGTLKMESISQAAISLENMSICLIAMVSNSRKTQLTKAFGTL